MGDIPVPRSYAQILGDQLDAFLSAQGISNLRAGSAILSILEASAQSDFRSSHDIFSLLNAIGLDKATGLALRRKGNDEGVPQQEATQATGTVTIGDSSFTKKATKLFQGTPAPIAGSVSINVIDASSWTSTGSVYFGRGTPNYEGPLPYTSKTDNGTHWTLALSTPTQKFHNTSETAILAQGGNRTVGPEIVCLTPQGNLSSAVEFKILYAATIPDGETSITGVQVQAKQSGIIGNVPANAINRFATQPFIGATVYNPEPFSNGLPTELDDDYRERIRNKIRTRAKGTRLAITTEVTGVKASDENKRVSSASFVKSVTGPSTLYIDDGTGYEERRTGVSIETLMDSALGGEFAFQVKQTPIAKAFAITSNTTPYVLSEGAALTVKVGGVAYTHNFLATEFTAISNASAYEVVASINANSSIGFLARTSDSGTRVVLFAKAETNDDIEVVTVEGNDANDSLGVPLGLNYTLRLYKNDRLLSKDGSSALLYSNAFSFWDTMSGSQTLTIAVDGTPAQTYTFTDQDFVDGATGFATLGKNSVASWITVLNNKIPGITASLNSGVILLTSNAGPVSKAAIEITGGTLVSNHMFASGSATGAQRDYVIDRSAGQIELSTPLTEGDRLTVGSRSARAFLESLTIPTTTLASTGSLWFSVDGDAEIIAHGITSATSLNITVSSVHAWGHKLKIQAASGTPFTNVSVGDSIVLWDTAIDASLRGALKVVDTDSSAYVVVERRLGKTLRAGHAATVLIPSGSDISKVLTTGGFSRSIVTPSTSTPMAVTNTCEIFDPNTLLVTATNAMATARAHHTATLVTNGKVVVVGGIDDAGNYLDSIEIYTPSLGTWTTSNRTLDTGLAKHRAVALSGSTVLICGGYNGSSARAESYIYDVVGNTLTPVGLLSDERWSFGIVVLPSGDVMVAGGYTSVGTAITSVESFNTGTLSWSALTSLPYGRANFGLSVSSTTEVLAAGANIGIAANDTYHVYNIAGNSWSGGAFLPSSQKFEFKDSVTLHSGKVALLHSFASPATAGAVTYETGVGVTLRAANTLMTETATKYDTQYVLLYKLDASYLNHVVAIGGLEALTSVGTDVYAPTSAYEMWNGTAFTWSVPDPAVASGVTLPQLGIAFVRSSTSLQETEFAAAANYTASSFVNGSGSSLASQLRGATPTVYRTSKIRVSTNSYASGGGISLVTANTEGESLQLISGTTINNLNDHPGSVESGSSESGTPSFEDIRVLGATTPAADAAESIVVSSASVDSGYGLVGLRNWDGGTDGSIAVSPASIYNREGSNLSFRTSFLSATNGVDTSVIDTRLSGTQPWNPLDRVYLAAPFALVPGDDLTVLVDNDSDRRFSIGMTRALTTVGSTYSQSNKFRDGNAGGASLATTFGLTYSFDDYVVYMRPRAIAFAATTKALLLRYYRHGRDGENARVRFSNALGPNTDISVDVDVDTDSSTDIRIRLKGGASRTPTIRATSKVGVQCTAVDSGDIATLIFILNLGGVNAARTSNITTLTPTLPGGITNHGLQVGDVVYVTSTSGSFSSGAKTITSKTFTTISYAEVAADATASGIGTISFDSQGEVTTTGAGILAGDFLNILDPNGTFMATQFVEETFRITAVTAGKITTTSGESPAGTFTVGADINWETLDLASNFQVFANPAQTATQVLTAVNALAAVTDSTCPITLTSLGAGSGTVDRSTPEFLDDSMAWYTLADGVNYVASTTLPVNVSDDYTLIFKNPVTGTLSTSSDWANETIYIAPSTAASVVDWLNAPTVSGLFTACSVQASDDGKKIQITSSTSGSAGSVQVQGGRANGVTAAVAGAPRTTGGVAPKAMNTIDSGDADGLRAGMWCSIENTLGVPRAGIFTSGTTLTSWAVDGTLIVSTPVYTVRVAKVDARLQFEAQGDFIAISDFGVNTGVSFATTEIGDYIRIATAVSPSSFAQTSSANQGIFRIVQVVAGVNGSGGTVWIENSTAIEEVSQCNVSVYSGDSIQPGDEFVINTPLWGVQNQGTWTVESVGESGGIPFASTTTFKVSTTDRAPVAHGAAVALGTSSSLVQAIEGTPARFVLKIDGLAPNQIDGSFIDLRWNSTVPSSNISEAAGSIITALDKLRFPLTFASGVDGYSYNNGLIGEVNRVVQGDPSDTTTYPGVAAAGASINVAGPLVKRISIALVLRTRSGVANEDVANRVRSAVATVINQTPIGNPVALSKVVAAATKVVGVIAVTVASPSYAVGSDLIDVQPAEKPLVLSLNDISIAFTGE